MLHKGHIVQQQEYFWVTDNEIALVAIFYKTIFEDDVMGEVISQICWLQEHTVTSDDKYNEKECYFLNDKPCICETRFLDTSKPKTYRKYKPYYEALLESYTKYLEDNDSSLIFNILEEIYNENNV